MGIAVNIVKGLDSHILFVEDNQDTREVVSLVLRVEGYKVTGVETVAEALQLAKSERFDLYLLDIKLPDGSGVELCKVIRGFDAHTPIVFFSANAYKADIRNALGAGAQEYLVKPCDLEELEETIEKLLNDKS
jgi:DNA-binding response OmpR family regulator